MTFPQLPSLDTFSDQLLTAVPILLHELCIESDFVLVCRNESTLQNEPPPPTAFVGRDISISIKDYSDRLISYGNRVEDHVILVSLHLLLRYHIFNPGFVRSDTVHRLWGTALIIASKYLVDHVGPICCKNMTYQSHVEYHCALGGISLQNYIALEGEFLVAIGWSVSPLPETMKQLVATIQRIHKFQTLVSY